MEDWVLISVCIPLALYFRNEQSVRRLLSKWQSKSLSYVAAVGGRDEFVPCSSGLMVICIHWHATAISAFPCPPAFKERRKESPCNGRQVDWSSWNDGCSFGGFSVYWMWVSSLFQISEGKEGGTVEVLCFAVWPCAKWTRKNPCAELLQSSTTVPVPKVFVACVTGTYRNNPKNNPKNALASTLTELLAFKPKVVILKYPTHNPNWRNFS